MTGFVFSTAACVNPRPPYFRLLSWRGVLVLSRPVKRSQPLSPCEAFSASLTLWNVLALPHPVERSRPLSVERSRPLTLWNILTVSHPVERSRPLSPCRTFSPSLILWELCPPGHLGNVL